VSRRTTAGLGVAALVLAAVTGAEGWYLWGSPSPTPDAQRPVVVGDVDAQAAVDAAATDVAAIFSTPWRHYDAHLARVTTLMTHEMAARYRRSSGPVRDHVVSSRTDTTTRVAASGVVRASDDEVLALLFLDQRTSARGVPPAYAARRALVTMVRTDAGWLVDNVQTR
jgi:Mce-associated membrane protein